MDAAKLLDQIGLQLKWLFFYSRYCAGKNISGAFCDNFRYWAMGTAALAALLVVWWLMKKLMRYYADWRYRRASAKVADPALMDRYRWTGDARPEVRASTEEIAAKIRKAVPSAGSSLNKKD
jgi:hypothetical protein